MKIRLAREEDSSSIKKIDAICTQGQAVVYHYQRDDFFLRTRQYARSAVYVAEIDGAVVGCVSASIKTVRYNDQLANIVYFYDIRVDPGQRRKGIASALYRESALHLRKEGIKYGFIYILGSNKKSLRFVKALGVSKMASFRVYFLPAIKMDQQVNCTTQGKDFELLCAGVEEKTLRYDLSEERCFIRNYESPPEDSPYRGTFTFPEVPGLQVSLWDSTQLSTKVVDRVSLSLRVAALLPSSIKEILRIPAIPERGTILRTHHLFDLICDDQNRAKADQLIAAVCSQAAREGGRLVMCHLDTRDPLCDIVKKHSRYSIEGAILMRDLMTGAPLPPLKTAYLDVRDF
jgi:ribosomal protein S18 acetylase RimI-like enzyme